MLLMKTMPTNDHVYRKACMLRHELIQYKGNDLLNKPQKDKRPSVRLRGQTHRTDQTRAYGEVSEGLRRGSWIVRQRIYDTNR